MVETYTGCKPDIQLEEIMSRPETTYEDKWIHHLIKGTLNIEGVNIPILSRELSLKDRMGSLMVRLGLYRMAYHFPPGLYFIGDEQLAKEKTDIPVLVTCNYKLTLDAVRSQLKKEAYWLLVLDTKGVNVWCAAGKGTFGTEELIFQLVKNQVGKVTGAKTVILPQLGASRMTPHIVKNLTQINPVYGPIRSEDIDPYLNQGGKATEAQRTVSFNWRERLVLTPIEFLMSFRYLGLVYLFMIFYNFIWGTKALSFTTPIDQTLPFLIALFTGAVIFPLALPILPFRAFSLKSLALSLPMTGLIWLGRGFFAMEYSIGGFLGLSLLWIWAIGYIALNFTGSTTFTSLSGVAYEVEKFKKTVPFAIGASVVSLILGLWV